MEGIERSCERARAEWGEEQGLRRRARARARVDLCACAEDVRRMSRAAQRGPTRQHAHTGPARPARGCPGLAARQASAGRRSATGPAEAAAGAYVLDGSGGVSLTE